jgi:hypothetical protein
MDFCPHCGRDLRPAQKEAVERLLRKFEHDPELVSLLTEVRRRACEKATPYETLKLLEEVAASPKRVIERALDIYREKRNTLGGSYSSEYFRVLLNNLRKQYDNQQISIPIIDKE